MRRKSVFQGRATRKICPPSGRRVSVQCPNKNLQVGRSFMIKTFCAIVITCVLLVSQESSAEPPPGPCPTFALGTQLPLSTDACIIHSGPTVVAELGGGLREDWVVRALVCNNPVCTAASSIGIIRLTRYIVLCCPPKPEPSLFDQVYGTIRRNMHPNAGPPGGSWTTITGGGIRG